MHKKCKLFDLKNYRSAARLYWTVQHMCWCLLVAKGSSIPLMHEQEIEIIYSCIFVTNAQGVTDIMGHPVAEPADQNWNISQQTKSSHSSFITCEHVIASVQLRARARLGQVRWVRSYKFLSPFTAVFSEMQFLLEGREPASLRVWTFMFPG